MFRSVRADLSHIAKVGTNVVRVVCRSPELEAIVRAERLDYPIPLSAYPVQSPHRNLLRKVQCHGGWDWGPCLMVAGIYGNVYVDVSWPGRIEGVSVRTLRSLSQWNVPVKLEYLVSEDRRSAAGMYADGKSATVDVVAELVAPDGEIEATGRLDGVVVTPGINTLDLELHVEDPLLWWPAGYGDQPLYTLTASVTGTDRAASRAKKRIGFRELRVVAEEDAVGRSLTFRVNDRDIWAKGANWIPQDALPARQTAERTRTLLEDMVAANMNMVRVWGGGQYESDAFYDSCDELGILVWQDMMFACSLYPTNRAFLDDVREEIASQVKRLKEHPSIALWCGNNENVGALNWYPESRTFRDRYVIDYDRLNEGVVGATIRALDPDRVWWPSSPSAGPDDFSDNWHADNRGDMHFWSVWHEGKPFEAYYGVTPRFCSEFGYQSFPSEEGVASYCPEDQRNLTSPVMEHHQKNPRGNSIIIENFSRYFRFPEGFANMLYLSQVQQALAMKTAVEYWRSRRPVCMGALFWQLDDCWPVASWSSIEYSGKWKLLHYAAARFFAPVALIAYKKDDRVAVFALNDTERAIGGALTVRLLRFDGSEAMRQALRVKAAAEASTEAWSIALTDLPVRPEEAFLVAEFTPDSPAAGDESGGPSAFGSAVAAAALRTELFLCEPKRCAPTDPKLQAEVVEVERGLAVRLNAAAPAFYVALDAPGIDGRWEDNFFTVLCGETRTVRFLAKGAAPTAAALRKAFRVTQLRGTYR
jgi:beta-mannosidase